MHRVAQCLEPWRAVLYARLYSLSRLVQSEGKPISHSTHSGLRAPPSAAIAAWSRRSLLRSRPLLRVSAAGLLPLCIVADGVGHISTVCSNVGLKSGLEAPPTLFARGVGHSPDPISPVRCTDGASWNNKRPAGVAFGFQVSQHVIETHADVPSNVFSNDPSGPEFSHEPHKFWPEVAVIIRALSLPGCGKGLAWVSAANNVNWSNIRAPQFPHVAVYRSFRPMLPQHLAREFLDFAECHGLETARPFQPEAEAADAAEKVQNAQHQEAPAARQAIIAAGSRRTTSFNARIMRGAIPAPRRNGSNGPSSMPTGCGAGPVSFENIAALGRHDRRSWRSACDRLSLLRQVVMPPEPGGKAPTTEAAGEVERENGALSNAATPRPW